MNLMQHAYADRQLIIVRPDDEVVQARQATPPSQPTADPQPDPAGAAAGIAGAALPLGLALSPVSRWRNSRAERREPFVLPVTRNEAKQLSFPLGHPLPDVVYVGNPAVPAVYYALAFPPTDRRIVPTSRVDGLGHLGDLPPNQSRARRAIKHPFE